MGLGVPAIAAYAYHDNNRNVPDEWVWNCQGSLYFYKKKQMS